MNKFGSSVSLSRGGNRSTSRVSMSQSVAPSKCSFIRDSAPYNDYQMEIFSMSDLDIPASIPVTIEEDRKRFINFDVGQQCVSAGFHKEFKESEILEHNIHPVMDSSSGIQKKELKVAVIDDPHNFERYQFVIISKNVIISSALCLSGRTYLRHTYSTMIYLNERIRLQK